MFERLFQRAVVSAARLLFAAALVMLLWGFGYAVWALSNHGMTGPSAFEQVGWIGAMLSIFAGAFAPAAQLFFGAAVIHRVDKWMEHRQHR